MSLPDLYERLTQEYLAEILTWAVRKTGSRAEGEDLTQDVMLQVFLAISKDTPITQMDRYVRKIAHYCWCNRLRGKESHRLVGLSGALRDNSDFAADFAAMEAHKLSLTKLRSEIMKLSRIQREAMISHYLEGLSVAETAERLHVTEGAVAWHLFDARKKVRRELDIMREPTNYLYRPGRLGIGCSGDPGPDPDTKRVADSLIRQNLCLLCYGQGKTIDELAGATGIPKPYLEFDLDWLVQHEFLSLEGKRYETAFPIIGKKHFQQIGKLYQATRGQYIDRILSYLWDHEADIRSVGFYGSSFPTERLMWSILTLFISYMSRKNPLLFRLKQRDQFPVRPDGGRYIVMAGDRSENQEELPEDITMPAYMGIFSDACSTDTFDDRYYWLGVYGFSEMEYRPDIVDRNSSMRQVALHKVYCSVIESGFAADSLMEAEQEMLSDAVADGLIETEGSAYYPRFVICTREQLLRLQRSVFQPLMEELMPKTEELGLAIARLHRANMPKINRCYIDYYTYVDLWDFGIYAIKFAVEDGRLWLPEEPAQGVPLTLVLVR